jgi:hypothetical protein
MLASAMKKSPQQPSLTVGSLHPLDAALHDVIITAREVAHDKPSAVSLCVETGANCWVKKLGAPNEVKKV